ncbi:hypothetical protein J2T04_001179 [Chryseobacterium lathyri]|uniref:HTH araC/xylS-type domain-containing protein n=1 Tax=Chryseobacterium lathyri TaxID=395933 RepID=A0ABT9SIQ0_9FLAO|nr:hypothetical protein [Chryseobacterium lathyri]
MIENDLNPESNAEDLAHECGISNTQCIFAHFLEINWMRPTEDMSLLKNVLDSKKTITKVRMMSSNYFNEVESILV